jgi:hypothetical protein
MLSVLSSLLDSLVAPTAPEADSLNPKDSYFGGGQGGASTSAGAPTEEGCTCRCATSVF